MAAKITCVFCFASFDSYYPVFMPGATEECPNCEQEFELADTEDEQDEIVRKAKEDDAKLSAATHCRLMAQGEDGSVFCIKNFIDKSLDEDLLNYILAGAGQTYPEAHVWFEDEESTSARHHANLLRELDEY